MMMMMMMMKLSAMFTFVINPETTLGRGISSPQGHYEHETEGRGHTVTFLLQHGVCISRAFVVIGLPVIPSIYHSLSP
jgi:hypothetical protein